MKIDTILKKVDKMQEGQVLVIGKAADNWQLKAYQMDIWQAFKVLEQHLHPSITIEGGIDSRIGGDGATSGQAPDALKNIPEMEGLSDSSDNGKIRESLDLARRPKVEITEGDSDDEEVDVEFSQTHVDMLSLYDE